MKQYNAFAYDQKQEKTAVLQQLFGSIGTNVSVGLLFICDYGKNIYIGTNVSVKIGNGCWIGGGVIILPGVTIGDGTVVGAGSVVTKDIPANCVAVENPCRVIRKINGAENSGLS